MNSSNIKSFITGIFKSPSNIMFSIQWLLLLILIALIPYAMSFKPFEQIFEHGSRGANYNEDPFFRQREFLSAVGINLSILSLLCALTGLMFKPRNCSRLVMQFSVALVSLWIGFRTYVYWVNGIHVVYTGDYSLAEKMSFDPAGMQIPEAYFFTLFLYPIAYFGTISLIWLAFRYAGKDRWHSPTVWVVLAMIGIMVLISLFSPGLMTWFMD